MDWLKEHSLNIDISIKLAKSQKIILKLVTK